jgi:hypothetical protein
VISTRAIATQGLGFGPRLTSVNGLWPVESGGSAPRRGPRPGEIISARRLQAIDEEDALLLLMTMTAGAGVLQ